ncbi:hypothetical protein [Pedobacter mucosus]|uniref:hypothetical protein n=1 Tax=Pedobacter mucosus TaxID=2895286 RepID=UPI001EE4C987|nr:hypothetical protein [Pedobacter mucosus]UKT62443.1 hypothetical protein LOK61_11795 [Pedobacter mucosus]
MVKKIIFLVFAIGLISCNQRKEAEANTKLLYFDIKGFFKNEINRLQRLKPSVDKTVSINGSIENKKIVIQDWNKELAIFLNADINKTSWKGSFTTYRKNESAIYKSASKKIPVKKISVVKENSIIKKIEILIAYKNILYQSNDTLIYYPDSLYEIKKEQDIRFLKKKKFVIVGKLK